VRRFFLGDRTHRGLVFNVFLYALLIAIGFVYPLSAAIHVCHEPEKPAGPIKSDGAMGSHRILLGNYTKAFRVLEYPTTLASSIMVSLIPSVIQAVVCSLVVRAGAVPILGQERSCFLLILPLFILPAQKHRYTADVDLQEPGPARQHPFSDLPATLDRDSGAPFSS